MVQALRANWAETTLAVFGVAGIIGALTRPAQLSSPLLAALLLVPTLGLAAAPVNSLAARRAALPAWLRERRRTAYRRERSALAAGMATGGVVAVAGVAALALALLFTGNKHPVQGPSLVGPAQGGSSAPAAPAPSSQTPSGTTVPSGPSSTATTPTTSPSGTSPATTPSASTTPSSPAPTPSTTTSIGTAPPSATSP